MSSASDPARTIDYVAIDVPRLDPANPRPISASKTARACVAGGEPLPTGSRANKRTHSGACRTRLCRPRKAQASDACVTATTATTPLSGHAWAETPPPPAATALAPVAARLARTPPAIPPPSRARVVRPLSPAQLVLFGPLAPGSVPDPRGALSEDHAGGLPQLAAHGAPRRTSGQPSGRRTATALDPITDARQRVPARRLPAHHLASGHPATSGSPLVAALADAILETHAKRSGSWGATHAKVSDASEPDAPARARSWGRRAGAEPGQERLRVVGAARR
jgi:hypothetical protein